MITALCNIFINSEEKLKLFKQTFPKVYSISDNWLIYIRGKYQKKVVNFIKNKYKTCQKNCTFFNNLNNNNWANSTQIILKKAKYNHIYIFLEDHFLQKSLKHFRAIIQEVKKHKIDRLQYSFFNIGISTNSVELLSPRHFKHFSTFTLNKYNMKFIQKYYPGLYPFCLPGIYSKTYLQKILDIENKTLITVTRLIQGLMYNIIFLTPRNLQFWFYLNKIVDKLNLRFVIYSPKTPFNLEKSMFNLDPHLLPVKVAVLNQELFANWDDDNGRTNSALIKRGLYPEQLITQRNQTRHPPHGKIYQFKKGQRRRYQFFLDQSRITNIPQKYIQTKQGQLQIKSASQSITLKTGESIWLNANIPHTITATQDTIFYSLLKP